MHHCTRHLIVRRPLNYTFNLLNVPLTTHNVNLLCERRFCERTSLLVPRPKNTVCLARADYLRTLLYENWKWLGNSGISVLWCCIGVQQNCSNDVKYAAVLRVSLPDALLMACLLSNHR